MTARRRIVWIALTLGIAGFASVVQASGDRGDDLISGDDGRNILMKVDPDQLAVRKLERVGARLRYDERKIGRPVIEVDLSGRPIGDEVLKELLPLRHLRRLNLSGTRITDEGLKTLAGIPSLHHLDIRGAHVSLIDSILTLEKAIPQLDIESDGQTGYVPPPAVTGIDPN